LISSFWISFSSIRGFCITIETIFSRLNIKLFNTLIGVRFSALFLFDGIFVAIFNLLVDLDTDGDLDRLVYLDLVLFRVDYNSYSNEVILDLFFLSYTLSYWFSSIIYYKQSSNSIILLVVS
jgi:hypothetical protein